VNRKDEIMSKVLERTGEVISNTPLTDRLFEVVIRVEDIPVALLPGQFIHVRIPGMEGHILRRPFSVYHRDLEASTIGVLYQVVGFGSDMLSKLEPEAQVQVLGPIGTPWQAPDGIKRALLVVGGVGAAPLYLHALELKDAGVTVDVAMGAQTKETLVARDRYIASLGSEPFCSTDDGSFGHAGFVTDVVVDLIGRNDYDYVAICGPEPMMRIISRITLDAGLPTFVSMERHMACGIGACLGCIVNTTEGNKRSCVDGPVFDAAKVVW
jgi:dihydroorotate dehydrogenase electron transfer subunit